MYYLGKDLVDKEKVTKFILSGYFLSGIIVFSVSLLSNCILGKYLIELYQYPGYLSLKKISLFGFIDRIENFMSLHWILSSFINMSMILYFIKILFAFYRANWKAPISITN